MHDLLALLSSLNPSESTSHAGKQRTHLFRIIDTLEVYSSVSYIIDSKYRFIYCNPAWDRFAKTNGAPQLKGEMVIGCDLFDTIPKVLQKIYADAFNKVAADDCVWEKPYQCSSPTQFRMYRMRIHFLKNRNWFLITNSLVVKRSHHRTVKGDSGVYLGDDGIIVMCSHCRCSRRRDSSAQWDFVPAYLRLKGMASLKVSHRLCPVCCAYFYPDLLVNEGSLP